MPVLNCYVDDRTMLALEYCARRTGRTVEDLAEAAISDAAIKAVPAHPAEIELPEAWKP